jgi:hypothetical protein
LRGEGVGPNPFIFQTPRWLRPRSTLTDRPLSGLPTSSGLRGRVNPLTDQPEEVLATGDREDMVPLAMLILVTASQTLEPRDGGSTVSRETFTSRLPCTTRIGRPRQDSTNAA